MINVHDLKSLPQYFADVREGRKRFEVRKNDRGFRLGDHLHLREFSPATGYTGEHITVRATSVHEGLPGVQPGYCVMDIEEVA